MKHVLLVGALASLLFAATETSRAIAAPKQESKETWRGSTLGSYTRWQSNKGRSYTCRKIGSYTYCD